jgi:predicted negative regulator of RcsB-dependent stress response
MKKFWEDYGVGLVAALLLVSVACGAGYMAWQGEVKAEIARAGKGV